MAPMKPLINVLTLTLILSTLTGCGKQPSDSTPPQEEIKYPDPVPDYPIEVHEPPPPPRVNPRTVPLPPANDDIPTSEPTYVLSSHRCFEGNPKSDLKHTTTIKVERHGFFVFRKTSIWMYDCHGGNCEKLYQLNRVVHGAFEMKQYCMEAIQDQNEFSICGDDQLKPIETYRGDMLELNAAVNATPMTLYCETTLPLRE
jgi:hypothetical protein